MLPRALLGRKFFLICARQEKKFIVQIEDIDAHCVQAPCTRACTAQNVVQKELHKVFTILDCAVPRCKIAQRILRFCAISSACRKYLSHRLAECPWSPQNRLHGCLKRPDLLHKVQVFCLIYLLPSLS